MEARANVQNRLDFIGKEVSRLDTALKQLQQKQKEKENEVGKLTARLQAMQNEAAKAAQRAQ